MPAQLRHAQSRHALLRRALLLLLLVIPAWAPPSAPARAATPDAALTGTLLGVFQAWRQAVLEGDLERALAQRDGETAAALRAETATADNRKAYLSLARDMLPDRVEVARLALDPDGRHAVLHVTAFKAVPKDAPPGGPKPGTVVGVPARLSFANEAGGWKFVDQAFGPERPALAAAPAPCRSEAWDGRQAFDDTRDVSAGGPIERVLFARDYTLIVFAVLGEANCAFLPPRAVLDRGGLDTRMLVAGAMVEIEGFPHRTDPTRLWVEGLTVRRK